MLCYTCTEICIHTVVLDTVCGTRVFRFQALGHYSENACLPEIILDRNSAPGNFINVCMTTGLSNDQRAPQGPLCMTKDQRALSNDQRALVFFTKDQRALTKDQRALSKDQRAV
jgi:hypothetical protein